MKPKPFIASWKDIDPGKKIKFTIKKALNGKMVMSLKLMTGLYFKCFSRQRLSRQLFPIVENIEGAKEKHEGKADTISGLKKLNDYSMEVTFKEKKVNYLEGFFAGPLLSKNI